MERILELSRGRKAECERWMGDGLEWDTELVCQCAYYPRWGVFGKPSPCLYCSFESPNPKCRRAHILVDTRI